MQSHQDVLEVEGEISELNQKSQTLFGRLNFCEAGHVKLFLR